jgi:hypothetical protein
MSELREAARAFLRTCDQVQRHANALAEELKSVIDPLVPRLTYTYGADDNGDPMIIILDLEEKYPWPGEDAEGEALEYVIAQAIPELSAFVASGTWLDKGMAESVTRALQNAMAEEPGPTGRSLRIGSNVTREIDPLIPHGKPGARKG